MEQNPWKAENMYKVFSKNQKGLEINIWDKSQAIRESNPDLLGAQEIKDHAFEVIGHLGPDFKVIMSISSTSFSKSS